MKIGPVTFEYSKPIQEKKEQDLYIIPKENNIANIFNKEYTLKKDVFVKEEIPKEEPKKKNVSFGYSNILKTLWKKGKLPSVTRGFYGGRLTQKNCSLEHLQCASQGGKTELSNLVLATKENNWARGDKPLKESFSFEDMTVYLKQFIDVQVGNFNGNEYIKAILKKVSELL